MGHVAVVATLALGLSLLLAPGPALAGQHGEAGGQAAKERSAQKSKAAEQAAEEAGEKAQGDAMRERRQERKEIQETYREEVEAGGERVKGKKPWWKFWGSDEAE